MDTKPLFDIGLVMATPDALEAIVRNDTDAGSYLHRHKRGDWGDISEEDKQLNDTSANTGQESVVSIYTLSDQSKICLTTEWGDQNKTTISLIESSME